MVVWSRQFTQFQKTQRQPLINQPPQGCLGGSLLAWPLYRGKDLTRKKSIKFFLFTILSPIFLKITSCVKSRGEGLYHHGSGLAFKVALFV